jgi:hypothetical protein
MNTSRSRTGIPASIIAARPHTRKNQPPRRAHRQKPAPGQTGAGVGPSSKAASDDRLPGAKRRQTETRRYRASSAA